MASCKFCGGTPLTHEHVFAKWLSPVFNPKQERELYVDFERFEKGVGTALPRRYTKIIDLQVKDFCGQCNQGWMNDLEVAVRPVLTRIHKGASNTISKESQAILASWAAKTAVTIQYVGTNPFVPRNHLDWLYKTHRPHPDTVVWLARYDGPKIISTISRTLIFTQPGLDNTNRNYGQVVTFVVGSLLFIILSIYLKNHRVIVTIPKQLANHLNLIWPTNLPVVWPNTGLDDPMRLGLIDLDWTKAIELIPKNQIQKHRVLLLPEIRSWTEKTLSG